MTPVSFTVWYSAEAASISWNWCGCTRVSMIATCWTIGITMWRPGSSVPVWTEPKFVTTPTLPAGTSTNGAEAPATRISAPIVAPITPLRTCARGTGAPPRPGAARPSGMTIPNARLTASRARPASMMMKLIIGVRTSG